MAEDAILSKYLPSASVPSVLGLIQSHGVHLKIVGHRHTKHGDYRMLANGKQLITVNGSLNPYRFLITLVHEIAHLVAYKKFGRRIKPHGKEWKMTFQHLMLPFIRPSVFPSDLLPLIAKHFKNPKASSSTDAGLAMALKGYDPESEDPVTFLHQLPRGTVFSIYNGRRFKKGNKRVKRYECIELSTGRLYLFQPNAEVEQIAEYKNYEY